MSPLPTQVILGAGLSVMAAFVAAALGCTPLAIASAALTAALACVAFAAQSERLREEQRLVYRPVYVRCDDVQRRIMSDD